MASSDLEPGFAKLKGEDFEYYMRTYSIVLGRNSKKSTVDVDLASSGGGMSISRHHARIFYDFQRRRFFLEVLGKNGCFVQGVLHLPGSPPVKLDSQDMVQIGDKEIYFLLPVRSILGGPSGPRNRASSVDPRPDTSQQHHQHQLEDGVGSGGGSGSKAGSSGQLEKKAGAERESDNQQLLVLEEKDVVSSVATVLSESRGSGDWMAMEKLHSEVDFSTTDLLFMKNASDSFYYKLLPIETSIYLYVMQLVERFGNVWHHGGVRKYLTSEDYSSTEEAQGKPWYGLLMLLRKYPQHFAINAALEFVSLVS